MPASGQVERRHLGPGSWLLPVAVGFALFMQTLDATVITNALPAMARDLKQDPLTLNLAITLYVLSLAVFLPVTGWLADRLGARFVFVGAIALFTLSSLACGISQNLWQLILARITQGAAASMMTPVGRLILLQRYSRDDLVHAMSFLIIPGLIGTVVGPALGGFIVTFASWQWIFFINLPMGTVGIWLVLSHVPTIPPTLPRPLDIAGFVFTAVGLAALVFGLENIGHPLMPVAGIAGLIVLGLIFLFAYVWLENRVQHPLLDLSLFRNSVFRNATIGGMLIRMAAGASPLLLALLFQIGLGLSPFVAGMVAMSEAFGSLLMIGAAKSAIARFGFRRLLTLTCALSAATFVCCSAFGARTPLWAIAAVLFIGGAVRSVAFAALNAVTFLQIDEDRLSRASSLSAVCQQVSVSVGVAGAALILQLMRTEKGEAIISVEIITPIFLVMAGCAALSVLFLRSLPARLGVIMSANRRA